jgi:hypothetical protein
MKNVFILGIALLVMGVAVIGYDHFSYTTKENILQIGPIKATADRTHTVSVPPIVGWLLVGGGAGLLAFGALSRKN